MNSKDKASKFRTRDLQPTRKKLQPSEKGSKNPTNVIAGSSASLEDDRDGNRKSAAKSNETKSGPRAKRNTKPALKREIETAQASSDSREMTTGGFLAAKESLGSEQETVLNIETGAKSESLEEPSSAATTSSSSTRKLSQEYSESEGDSSTRDCLHASTIERLQRITQISSANSNSGEEQLMLYHDDEEINQAPKTSSDSDELLESGAALTVDDSSESTFVVYPLGCCEFDETQLVSATSTKAIQKCILRLSNRPKKEETFCWGLDQSQPILMRLHEDYIQFNDLKTLVLLRSQPIHAIKTWAVDDDNNFAFVVEDVAPHATTRSDYYESIDYALLNEPSMVCYIFRSLDDDDMSCKVAVKLNEEISRYKEQMSYKISKSTRMQQMIEPSKGQVDDQTDAEDFADELEATNESTMHVKYIGKTTVPRPVGIDILNVAIDKCLADASKNQASRMASCPNQLEESSVIGDCRLNSGLVDVKLHVSPSSVIVENEITGEIVVECRIRYLTFMGISRRDIRWCGFIMQNTTNKSFEAHCFECHPTAGHVCEAIQASCTRMYERVVKTARQNETTTVLPTTRHLIRDTLAKTLSRIKLNPIR